MSTEIHDAVRDRYAQSALQVLAGAGPACCTDDYASTGCCGGGCCADAGPELYTVLERADLPDAASSG
jgi:hypothetical protein